MQVSVIIQLYDFIIERDFMKTFQIKHYSISSEKIREPLCLAVITDLHGISYGRENNVLISSINKLNPDAVLVAGDMIVCREKDTLQTAEKLLAALAEKYPVYYASGNHELKLFRSHIWHRTYWEYENRLKASGVNVLRNHRMMARIKANRLCLYGLEIPVEYYKKPFSPRLFREDVTEYVGKPKRNSFNILLAHNPKYAKAYFDWGADLILCGHYHGGILRLGEHTGVLSPQFHPFPRYCCGHFMNCRGQHLLVSAGLGEHTLPIRIHNPRELLAIHVNPLENSSKAG